MNKSLCSFSKKVIVRAIRPWLSVPGKLTDPALELFNHDGVSIASNDNWRSNQEAEIIARTLPLTNEFESAIVATLPPTPHPAIVRGANNTTEVALARSCRLSVIFACLRTLALAIAGWSALVLCGPVSGAGELDPTFNGIGYSRTGFGGANDTGNAIVSQSDGKVVVVGAAGDHFGVVRYNVGGSLDVTFGGTGKLITHFGAGKSVATAVRIQSDGKIVVAGHAIGTFETQFAVARYNADGSLDPTFGGDGKVTTIIRGVSDRAFALAIQADGKIVVAGESATFGGDYDFALVRYNPGGSLDTTFDTDGRLATPIGPDEDKINAVTLYGTKIIVAGIARIGTNDAFAVARYNADGSLDTTFNFSGKVFPGIGDDDAAYGVAIQSGNGSVLQPDKLVVAGYAHLGTSYLFAVVRFDLDGSLDTTFDFDGKATTAITGQDFGRALIVQGGGITPRKIVVGGYSLQGALGRFSAVRYNSDGSLDATFDGDGKLITAVGSNNNDQAKAIALQSSGRYVLAGSSFNGVDNDFGLLRCNSDGSLDSTFDGDGKRTDNVGNILAPAKSVVIQPDKKIIAAGSGGGQLRLVRYNPDGSLDNSFGNGGRASIPIGFGESGRAVALQGDGKIVLAGYTFSNGTVKVELIRCLPNGALDLSFDGDGKASLAVGQSAIGTAVAIQRDGKIVVAGYTETPTRGVIVARFNPNGMPDVTFDGDGVATNNVGFNASEARAIALQSDGKILVAGKVGQDFLLLRYNGNGSLDNSFDDDGIATVSLSAGVDQANALAVQPDGRIIVVGTSFDPTSNPARFAVARFNTNGSPDLSLAGSGKLTTALGSQADIANAVAVQPDGKILVAGSTYGGADRGTDLGVVRYDSLGALDTSYGSAGKFVLDLSGGNDSANGAALDDRGRLVLAGDGGGVFAVARLTTDFVPPSLGNISTRLRVETDDNVLIGGFIVTGTQPKKVIIRAIGPSLKLAGKLANPTLELFGPSGKITSNDNWQDSPNKQAIIDSTVSPKNPLESAIFATLPANEANYTAIVRGAGGGTGIGLVEVYDLDRAVDSKLANISSRGLVQTGDNVMIGGFIISGTTSEKVIVRAIGPSLTVPGKLADPTLELYDENAMKIATNNNWRETQEAEIIASTVPPGNDLESAIVATLPPTPHTAIVRGVNGTTGVALVEVYALD